jgi:transposase InsO family protein
MRFSFIARHRNAWQTRQLCEALGVSRAGFYEWLHRPESRRAQRDRQLLEQIRTSFEQSDRTYGSPRVWRDLRACLHHSDQGSEYQSEQFQRLLAEHGVVCSMSRRGDVWDNSAMESFFSSLMMERINRKQYRTRDQAKADVFDYIERFYNPRRRHSTNGL